MPSYKFVPEHNGIEIYFEKKPTERVCQILRQNGWKWHGYKQCWYAKRNYQTEAFAKEMCGTTNSKSVTLTQSSSFGSSTLVITENADKYNVSSTNNQIICCDCNKFFSIHAPACPFCGCPFDYVVKHYFTKFINSSPQTNANPQPPKISQQDIIAAQKAIEERERKKREEQRLLKEQQEREYREAYERRQRQLELQKIQQGENRKISEKAKEIGIHQTIINDILRCNISYDEFLKRIAFISQYKTTLPGLPINFSMAKYSVESIQRQIADLRKTYKSNNNQITRCSGDCSSCNREQCINK